MSAKILGIHDKEAVESMIAHVVSECKAVDTDEAFDDMLDECYSFEKVGGPFDCMSPSHVLKECDPTAYRCGKNDWIDSCEYIEIGSDYYRSDDVDEAQEQFIDGLRSELTDLQSRLEGETDANEADGIQDEITRKESQIEACENHQW